MSPRLALRLALLLGVVGTAAELVLLEHWEDWKQWAPFAVLATGLLALAIADRAPRLVRATGAVQAVTGLVGVWLHLKGNIDFERETDPALAGLALLTTAAKGEDPVLAPGAMVFIGLVLIVYTMLPTAAGVTGNDTGRQR